MANTPRKPPDWTPKFLEELKRTGIVSEAAALAEVGRRTAYDRRDRDEAFADAWDEIIDRTTDLMEREAYRRATVGTEKPVFQGGHEVGRIREYSDTLMMFLLRARRPNVYRERHLHEHSGDIDVNLSLVTDHELRDKAADLRRGLAATRTIKPSGPDAGDRA